MKTVSFLFVCSVILGFTSVIQAQVGGGSHGAGQHETGHETTMNALFEEAAAANPALRARFETYRATLARVPQAGALPDPELMFQYFINPVNASGIFKQFSVGVSQMFPWAGTLPARRSVAEWQAEAAFYRFQQQKLTLFRDITVSLNTIGMLRHHAVILEEQLNWALKLEQLMITRIETGAARRADLLLLEMERETLLSELLENETRITNETIRFNRLMNRDPDAESPGVATLNHRNAIQTAVPAGILLAQNPEIEEALAVVQETEAMQKAVQRSSFPQLGVSVEVMGPNSAMQMPGNRIPVFIGTRITLPVWRGRYKAWQEEAAASHRAAGRNLEDTHRTVQAAYDQLMQTDRQLTDREELFTTRLLPRARERSDVLVTDFSTGRARLDEVIQARRLTLSYTMQLEEVRLERIRVHAELDRLAGTYLDFNLQE